MKRIRSVYVVTDLEGVAGVDDWDPRGRDDASQARGVADRAEMQRLLTGEVNAAAEGLFAEGGEEVLHADDVAGLEAGVGAGYGVNDGGDGDIFLEVGVLQRQQRGHDFGGAGHGTGVAR